MTQTHRHPLQLESTACEWGINGTGEESEVLLTGQVQVGLGLANPFWAANMSNVGNTFNSPNLQISFSVHFSYLFNSFSSSCVDNAVEHGIVHLF